MNSGLFTLKNRYKVSIEDALNSKNLKWERNIKKKILKKTLYGNTTRKRTDQQDHQNVWEKNFFFFLFLEKMWQKN